MVEHTRASDVAPTKILLAGCHDTTIAASLTALGAFDVKKDKWPGFTSSIAFELFRRKNVSTSTADARPSGAIWPSKEKTWWYFLFSPRTSVTPPARSPSNEWSESDSQKLDEYYVRLRYNDKPVSVPFCKAAGRHLDGDASFCTLAAFKQAADSFTPRNWKAECAANLGKPTFSDSIEPPPGL